mmetsp:Transcript_3435/g.8959  ORF Transcript_3435/g.8959 Transcript_3435/m.8959 type:complete len:460 (+) Transcript_3435:823-2202(+)
MRPAAAIPRRGGGASAARAADPALPGALGTPGAIVGGPLAPVFAPLAALLPLAGSLLTVLAFVLAGVLLPPGATLLPAAAALLSRLVLLLCLVAALAALPPPLALALAAALEDARGEADHGRRQGSPVLVWTLPEQAAVALILFELREAFRLGHLAHGAADLDDLLSTVLPELVDVPNLGIPLLLALDGHVLLLRRCVGALGHHRLHLSDVAGAHHRGALNKLALALALAFLAFLALSLRGHALGRAVCARLPGHRRVTCPRFRAGGGVVARVVALPFIALAVVALGVAIAVVAPAVEAPDHLLPLAVRLHPRGGHAPLARIDGAQGGTHDGVRPRRRLSGEEAPHEVLRLHIDPDHGPTELLRPQPKSHILCIFVRLEGDIGRVVDVRLHGGQGIFARGALEELPQLLLLDPLGEVMEDQRIPLRLHERLDKEGILVHGELVRPLRNLEQRLHVRTRP